MKMKKLFTNRILSLVLAIVMVLGMVPMMNMIAYAAVEVPTLNEQGFVTYTDGVIQYVKYDNYLYKVKYTNLKNTEKLYLKEEYGSLRLQLPENYTVVLKEANSSNRIKVGTLPKTEGSILNCYYDYEKDVIDTSAPSVIITCVAVNEPTWSWRSTSSATATFIAKEADVCVTVNAEISSSTVMATNCLGKDQTTYTASATINGKQYTNIRTEEGDVGPHSYTYSSSGNTVIESCANCSNHTATATLTASNQTYIGSAITTGASVAFSDGWAGSKEHGEITYYNNTNAGDATAKVTVAGNELTTIFTIDAACITSEMVTLNPENGTYNGGAYMPSVSVAFNGAPLIKDIDYTLSWDKSGLTDQGTYTVRVVGIGNFTGSAEKTFTINAADLSTVKVEQSGTLTYDGGNELTPTVSANAVAVNNQPISFTYSTLQDGTYGSMPSFTNAGTYTVYYKATAPNHNEAKGSFTVTVEKAVPVYTAPTAKENLSYNGGEQELIVAGSTNGGQMQYSLDGTNYSNTIPEGKLPGDYTVYYRIVGNDNYKDVAPQTLTVKIDKCKQTAPESLTKTDETISKKSDGSISGITSDMEWRKAGETTYVIVTNEKYENLAAGTYYMRYQGNENYHPSPDAEIVIAAGRKLKINAPENQVGYTLTSDVYEVDYLGNATLTFALKEGYSKDDNFKIILNGNPDAQWLNGQLPLSGIYTDVNIVVEGVVDNTAPTAEIKVKDNGWTEFLNSITFGLFFKETQDVTITAADAGSGVKSIEYYLANAELSLAEVEAITSWKGYDEAFKIDPDNEYVIYVKVTDNDGNVCYISSNGIVLDATAPVISGVENGNTYYTTQKVTVTEKNVASIQLNGETAGSDITLEGNKNATYTIIVTDKAGNVSTVTVTMKPISDLAAPIAALNKDSVNSENEQAVDGVKAAVAAVDTTNATEQEKAALKGISDKVAELEKAIDEAKASSEEQNKTNSPATGDTNNLGLWVALFFISGSAVITLIVVDRKRRMVGK